METHTDFYVLGVGTFLALCNLILSSLVVLTFFTSKKLQQHPSGIILKLALSELGVAYHSMITMWNTKSVISKLTLDKMKVWKVLQLDDNSIEIMSSLNIMILSLWSLLGLIYNIVLCIDLILTLRYPFSSGYKRMKYYNIVGFTLGIAFCIPISLEYTGHSLIFGEQSKEISEYIIGLLFLVYFILGGSSIMYAGCRINSGLKLTNSKMKSYLIRHILYVFFYVMTCLYSLSSYVFRLFDSRNLLADTIALFAISISGIALSIVRLTDPNIRTKISTGKVLTNEKGDNQDDEWRRSISSVVDELSFELTASILDSLYFVYSRKDLYTPKEITKSLCKEKKFHSGQRRSRLALSLGMKAEFISSELVEYCPHVFDIIRYNNGMDNERISHCVDPNKNYNTLISASESEGKSGSFFMKTTDQVLIIKTIKFKEIQILIKNIKDYAEYIINNPKSLLCKIYGCFSLKLPGVSEIHLLVMENILEKCTPSHIYDLKGSTLGRKTKKSTSGPLKDLDFILSKSAVSLNSEDFEAKKSAVEKDSKFLAKHNLMDYSLIVSIEKNTIPNEEKYTMGIIDFLTHYGFTKRLERAFVILLNPKSSAGASVINPRKYAERFASFIIGKVIKKK
jgi:1-phosphatidylinositol-4-phosphate 5-kinase